MSISQKTTMNGNNLIAFVVSLDDSYYDPLLKLNQIMGVNLILMIYVFPMMHCMKKL